MFKANEWAQSFMIFVLTAVGAGCSKTPESDVRNTRAPEVEVFPIANTQLARCRFTQADPTYAFNSKIAPNAIRCDEGVPKRVEVLNQNPLPAGLELDVKQLALIGTAKEKVTKASYIIYLENEAGYVKIPLTITIQ